LRRLVALLLCSTTECGGNRPIPSVALIPLAVLLDIYEQIRGTFR